MTMTPFSVEGLSRIINRLLPEPHAGLLAGIVFGTKASLSKDLSDALVKTGTLHIVALSGMNITIMASLVNFALLWFVSRRVSSLLTMLLIWWFVWFVGPSPSIVRAAIMGCISLLAVIFGRQNWALLTWMLAVGGMLLLNFSWLTDLSFQLSALATLGIILFGGKEVGGSQPNRGARAVGKVLFLAQENLRLTLSAQVFTIPLIFFHFHRISLISPLPNVLIGWTLAPLTVMGWLVSVVGSVWLPLGQAVGWVAWVFLEYLIQVVVVTSKIPLASVGW